MSSVPLERAAVRHPGALALPQRPPAGQVGQGFFFRPQRILGKGIRPPFECGCHFSSAASRGRDHRPEDSDVDREQPSVGIVAVAANHTGRGGVVVQERGDVAAAVGVVIVMGAPAPGRAVVSVRAGQQSANPAGPLEVAAQVRAPGVGDDRGLGAVTFLDDAPAVLQERTSSLGCQLTGAHQVSCLRRGSSP
jgi:hypothetical protein